MLAGHAILRAVHLPLRHDLYCALVGAYAIWGIAFVAVQLHSLSQRVSRTSLFREAATWLLTLGRVAILGVLGLVVVPFMAGLYLDMVMLPLRSVTAMCLIHHSFTTHA